jgi:hypothetical protein
MARRVDQVEVVDLAIARLVLQRSGLRLDGYPTLFLDVHRVEHLGFHLAVRLRPPQRWIKRSASVDLPWSMCAMIEKFLM